jgi:hypothetical protein
MRRVRCGLRRTVCALEGGPVGPSRLALLVVADHPPSAFGVVRVVSERGTDRDGSDVGVEGNGVRRNSAEGEERVKRCGGGHFSG